MMNKLLGIEALTKVQYKITHISALGDKERLGMIGWLNKAAMPIFTLPKKKNHFHSQFLSYPEGKLYDMYTEDTVEIVKETTTEEWYRFIVSFSEEENKEKVRINTIHE